MEKKLSAYCSVLPVS